MAARAVIVPAADRTPFRTFTVPLEFRNKQDCQQFSEDIKGLVGQTAVIVATDDTFLSKSELRAALHNAAARAHDELHWLSRLPASVLAAPAPTDDQADAPGGAR